MGKMYAFKGETDPTTHRMGRDRKRVYVWGGGVGLGRREPVFGPEESFEETSHASRFYSPTHSLAGRGGKKIPFQPWEKSERRRKRKSQKKNFPGGRRGVGISRLQSQYTRNLGGV